MPKRSRKSIPRISRAEWEVMKVVWAGHPVSANGVVRGLGRRTSWSPRTVKTMLNRLVRKGALTFEAEGRRYLYSPAVSRQECVRAESESFLHRVFEGAPAAMLVHFVRSSSLSPADIQTLREILDEKGQGR